jgi:hypothetical protein
VLYNSAWRTVCANNWDVNEASVTCRQLGIFTSGAGKFKVTLIFSLICEIHSSAPTFSNSTVDTGSIAVSITCGSRVYDALGDCSVGFAFQCARTDRVEVQCCKFK